ncbi:hypothetical protein HNQ77_000932 [Silvibacterium bohemicum]|uniref:Uncharacterized protein n=1 Tax=Silvibacterium bohemicum TaxID=1577686 RepID=A0A841JX23_9BACT|nr:hypothetical protein [Silvibacterium bohemicum]MBB6142988.1 hypothetical protein [Silvibacterium bohemicum]
MSANFLLTATAIAFGGVLLYAQTSTLAQASAVSQPNSQTHSTDISPSKAAKIEEMLPATGTKPQLLQILGERREGLKRYADRKTVVPGIAHAKVVATSVKEKQLTDDYLAKINGIADTELTWDEIKPTRSQERGLRQHLS